MIELEIPLLSPTNNKLLGLKSRHWGLVVSLRKQWLKAIELECLLKGVVIKPFSFAEVEFTRVCNRLPDYDNLVGGLKFVLDCLTLPRERGGKANNKYGLGFLIDDSPDYCRVSYEAVYTKKRKDQKTIIRIRDGRVN